MSDSYREIIDFWIGDAPTSGETLERRYRVWFRKNPGLDAEIASRFGALLEKRADGVMEAWKARAPGRLALIILFDQFSRNIHRGRAEAFANDPLALELTIRGISLGQDLALDPVSRMFFYMPLQHAESLEHQDRSVALFSRLVDACDEDQRPLFQETLKYAREHRDLIARFGRFPHRNRTLGRETTAAEAAYLAAGGATYGQ